MNKIKMLLAAVLVAGVALPVSAQKSSNDGYPYTYVGIQGGGQVTFTNYDASKLITPIGAVSVGHFFSPVVGTRLHFSGINEKGGFKSLDKTYDYKYFTGDIDVMFNLCNLIKPNRKHDLFNAILLGGVGLGYAWDGDDFNKLQSAGVINEPYGWSDDRLTHNFRVGMMFEFNVARHVGVNLEVAANNLHDRFNMKHNGRGDWQATAMVGLSFKFGMPKRKQAPVQTVTTITDATGNANVAEAVAPAPVVKEEPKPGPKPAPVVKPAPAKTRVEVFFGRGKSSVTASEEAKVAKLAGWLKDHPTATAELTGYADKGTGNANINMRLSKERAAAVKKLLVEKYGISASRISDGAKGDTVQPFSNNDSNRAVIVLGSEK